MCAYPRHVHLKQCSLSIDPSGYERGKASVNDYVLVSPFVKLSWYHSACSWHHHKIFNPRVTPRFRVHALLSLSHLTLPSMLHLALILILTRIDIAYVWVTYSLLMGGLVLLGNSQWRRRSTYVVR